MRDFEIVTRKSLLATLFIALGVAANLSLGYPIGPFLFAFGLMMVCFTDSLLYTGIVGYSYRKRPEEGIGRSYIKRILYVLFTNSFFGVLIGYALGLTSPHMVMEAVAKVMTFELSAVYFIKAMFCGAIMYLCVYVWKKYRVLYGIFLGVPLFIFCGFQHSIANAIMLGVAAVTNPMTWGGILCVMLAAAGNAVGAIFTDSCLREEF